MICHTMTIWKRIIDRRLREETSIGEEQFGFMPCRGTTDAIFAARQVIEKHREMQKELHMVFIDLEKAYDMGNTARSLEVFGVFLKSIESERGRESTLCASRKTLMRMHGRDQ